MQKETEMRTYPISFATLQPRMLKHRDTPMGDWHQRARGCEASPCDTHISLNRNERHYCGLDARLSQSPQVHA
jgi:hypothetical protein